MYIYIYICIFKMYLQCTRLQAWPTKYKIVFYYYSAMNILIENKNISYIGIYYELSTTVISFKKYIYIRKQLIFLNKNACPRITSRQLRDYIVYVIYIYISTRTSLYNLSRRSFYSNFSAR